MAKGMSDGKPGSLCRARMEERRSIRASILRARRSRPPSRRKDGRKTLYQSIDPSGAPVKTAFTPPILLFREGKPPVSIEPPFEGSVKVFVGSAHGVMSGDEQCIMRPDLPAVYQKATGQFYWTPFDEIRGWSLCTSKNG